MDMLEEEGWLENSVIVVASDNGACPDDGGTNYPLRGSKHSLYEGGTKVGSWEVYPATVAAQPLSARLFVFVHWNANLFLGGGALRLFDMK